jgi:hypothetical protein
MPVPGRTGLVTCDISGRIVDFDIQEGKGDLRVRIADLGKKWQPDILNSRTIVTRLGTCIDLVRQFCCETVLLKQRLHVINL